VGDILVQGERGAQILVDPELVEHFETSLTQVGCFSSMQLLVGVWRAGAAE
jgi:RNA-binding protein YlmH